MIGIYKITSPTGRIYIGQSWDYKKRLSNYNKMIRGSIGPVLFKSLYKYGPESHKFELIYQLPKDVSQEVMNNIEILFISAYKDCNYKMLNVTLGGSGIFGYKHTDETIKIMRINNSGSSNPNFGKGLHGELNGNFGKGLSGEKNGMFNRKHSVESIEKMRKNKAKFPVLKIGLNGDILKEYDSLAFASRAENIWVSNISCVCNGRKKSAGGFIWKYKQEKTA